MRKATTKSKAATPVTPATPAAAPQTPSTCSVLRWIGHHTDAKPKAVLEHVEELHLHPTPARATIQRQLLLGRHGKMKDAEISNGEGKRLQKLFGRTAS